jgi:hypothetical protein
MIKPYEIFSENLPFGGAPNPPSQHTSWTPFLQNQYSIPPGSPGANLGNELTALSYVMFLLELEAIKQSNLRTFIENFGDGQAFFNTPTSQIADPMQQVLPSAQLDVTQLAGQGQQVTEPVGMPPQPLQHPLPQQSMDTSDPAPIVPTTKQEAFLLTAADQAPGTREARLARVIRSKYGKFICLIWSIDGLYLQISSTAEAGLLKPYNYVKGYARLSQWMERK